MTHMIGALHGKILLKKSDTLIVMVNGIGYNVYVTASVVSSKKIQDEILLYTYTHVREDQLQLFGFLTPQELQFFELLLSVSGIGPKTALAIIEQGAGPIREAIVSADVAFFTSIPRLGTKNAQKIIIELKSKLGGINEINLQGDAYSDTQELMDALTSVGFTRTEVLGVIKKLPETATTVNDKVRYALKLLGATKL